MPHPSSKGRLLTAGTTLAVLSGLLTARSPPPTPSGPRAPGSPP
ncbi:hypothetical protein [Kitasatospora sp. NPDC088346]